MEEEEVTLCPVLGWKATSIPDANVLLQIDYLPSDVSGLLTTKEMRALAKSIRFGMSALQCIELAVLLHRAADDTRKRHTAETKPPPR